MARIAYQISTGKFLEYQSRDADVGTLWENAVTAGYDGDDVTEGVIDAADWPALEEELLALPERRAQGILDDAKALERAAFADRLGLTPDEFETMRSLL